MSPSRRNRSLPSGVQFASISLHLFCGVGRANACAIAACSREEADARASGHRPCADDSMRATMGRDLARVRIQRKASFLLMRSVCSQQDIVHCCRLPCNKKGAVRSPRSRDSSEILIAGAQESAPHASCPPENRHKTAAAAAKALHAFPARSIIEKLSHIN